MNTVEETCQSEHSLYIELPSGVLNKREMLNMQGGGSRGPRSRSADLGQGSSALTLEQFQSLTLPVIF